MQTSFSRRHGLDLATGPLTYNALPDALRLELFRMLQAGIFAAGDQESAYTREYAVYRDLCIHIHRTPAVLCGDEDDVAERYRHEHLLQLLTTAAWHQVLSMIELLVPDILSARAINDVFKAHRVGYRVRRNADSGRMAVENFYEGDAQPVREEGSALTEHPDIREILEQARRDLASPTGVNAARAAASAVQVLESYLKRWIAHSGQKAPATLADAIKALRTKFALDPQFLNALEQIYIWRNRTPGVGHGGATPPATSVAEALFVIDQACSFVNYFSRQGKSAPATSGELDAEAKAETAEGAD